VTIVNYASIGTNKLRASLTDDARVIIYNRHMFIVQATVLYGMLKWVLYVCSSNKSLWGGLGGTLMVALRVV
jgi:hypothetical protein